MALGKVPRLMTNTLVVAAFMVCPCFLIADDSTVTDQDTKPPASEGDRQAEESVQAIGSLMTNVAEALLGSKSAQSSSMTIGTNDPRSVPSHEQESVIKIAGAGTGKKLPLQSFCLDGQGRILTGIGSATGQVYVLDSDGKTLDKWDVPVKVEAISRGPEDSILIGGNGVLVKLDSQGKVLLEKEAPHITAIRDNVAGLRKTVIEQHEQTTKAITQQLNVYEERIKQLQERIKKLKAAASDKDDAESKPDDAISSQLVNQESMLKAFRRGYDSMKRQSEQMGAGELTEKQITEQVEAMINYKKRLSSISFADGDVYVTCGGTTGYGFDVWRMDESFENAKKIVSELRGCCGQMDAQAGLGALYVAENGRHRVCRYDRDGKMTASWGKSARKGVEGFGGCCNPKNVTFGPGEEVYTVEDTNGRIKRYSLDGKLLGLVGTAEIGPGCLDISLAVSKTGDRVYMLDTDRDQIVMLARRAPAAKSEVADGLKNPERSKAAASMNVPIGPDDN